jgi:DNA polymerase III epsilon subunit-like protein
MRTTEWVLIDTETSGLGQPIYCVELAAQRMKGVTPDGAPFRALLNHEVNIDPQAEALHGYSRAFLRANGRGPDEVHREFNAYAADRPVVAYNLSFDWARVLEPELKRLGMTPTYRPGFCALTLARRCVDETASHKLETLRSHFFPNLRGPSHHALDDVAVTAKLLIEIIWPRLERAGIESFAAVEAFSRKTPVRQCLDRVRNPTPQSIATLTPVTADRETQLIAMIQGMLADDHIVDAEVWGLKSWLDTHADHKSDVAERSRRMIKAAFADGDLSAWELDDIKHQLRRLTGNDGGRPHPMPPTHAEVPPAEPKVEKKRRLSLTKRQMEEETGAALLALLGRIVADGVLSDADIDALTHWLLENQSEDLPAVGYLLEIVSDIVADGKITDSERVDLFLGIEKVLPVTERRVAKAAREETEAKARRENEPKISRADLEAMRSVADQPLRPSREAGWRADPMTEPQAAFIRSLGGTIRRSATKGEASDLIESLLGKKQITSRQQMVMRFWARERQPDEGPREVSEWMDAFYQEDGDRKLAWDLFKNETEDNGLQGDPNRVPLGVGPDYLARIKAGGDSAVPKFRTGSATFVRLGNTPTSPAKPAKRVRRAIGATIAATALVVLVLSFWRGAERRRTSPDTNTPSLPSQTPFPAPTNLPPESPPTGVSAAPNENQTLVRRLRIVGLIGGARPRVVIEGKLFGVGDVVDQARGILVHSINTEARTITFIDGAGEIYSRKLE